jgi:hypothetical protein
LHGLTDRWTSNFEGDPKHYFRYDGKGVALADMMTIQTEFCVIHRFQKWIIGIGTVLMRLAGFEEGI